MSNIPNGVVLSTVVDPIVDFSSKPSYLVHNSKVDSAFLNITPINNYSSSLITVKLNFSNALSQIADRVMMLTVPVKFNIAGKRNGAVGTPNLLADNEFGIRSNAFLKCINVSTVNVGSAASYTLQSDSGIIINALEASAPMFSYLRQLNNIDNQMFDNCANYDDLLYTNRNVLGLFSNNSGVELGRCAYDIQVLENKETSAVLLVNFRFAIFVSPMLQTIHVNSGEAGFSHIDQITFNFALTNLNTRLLSFARQTNNGVLEIDSVSPQFGPNIAGLQNPYIEWTTYNILSSNFILPPQVNYPLPQLDRYSQLVGIPSGTTQTVASNVVSLNVVPSYALIFAGYPENLYSSENFSYGAITNIHGSQLTDAFASIQTINAQVNSVNQMNNSTQVSLWKSYIRNGGNKTFQEWSGIPLIKTLNNGAPQYLYPSSGPVKLDFSTDLSVRSPDGTTLSPGTNFKFNCSFQVTVKNTLPYTDQLLLYVVYVYPAVLCLSGVNNSQIVQAPLSVENNMMLKAEAPTGHSSVLNSHDLVGYGLVGKMHKLITNRNMAHKMRKHRMHMRHLQQVMSALKPVVGSGNTGGRKHCLRM